MKTLMLIVAVALSGCAGTMFDGRVCTVATNTDAMDDIATIVDSYTTPEQRVEVDKYLRTAKLTATALCEMARARQALQEKG